jgi:hypothetical protein
MGLRNLIRRLERSATGDLDSFKLRDGSIYYYDPVETYKEMFLHAYDVELGHADEWPQPPEIYRKICEARDPAAVLARFEPKHPEGAFVNPSEVFDLDVLVRERRLVPMSSLRSHTPGEAIPGAGEED